MYLRQHTDEHATPTPGKRSRLLVTQMQVHRIGHGLSDESVSVHVFPQLKLLRGDQETVPETMPQVLVCLPGSA
jgi:hypothetical protein